MILLMLVAGGLGAVARFLLDGLIRLRLRDSVGIATSVINVTGSVVLGLFAGLIAAHVVPPTWHMVVGTGFFGGYTTFSTASYETVRLAQSGRLGRAMAYAASTAVLCLVGAAAGYALGLWL